MSEIDLLKSNIDSWIKEIMQELHKIEKYLIDFKELEDNVQHNFELIYGLKDEIEEIKQEINALKLIQIISLKKKE